MFIPPDGAAVLSDVWAFEARVAAAGCLWADRHAFGLHPSAARLLPLAARALWSAASADILHDRQAKILRAAVDGARNCCPHDFIAAARPGSFGILLCFGTLPLIRDAERAQFYPPARKIMRAAQRLGSLAFDESAYGNVPAAAVTHAAATLFRAMTPRSRPDRFFRSDFPRPMTTELQHGR